MSLVDSGPPNELGAIQNPITDKQVNNESLPKAAGCRIGDGSVEDKFSYSSLYLTHKT